MDILWTENFLTGLQVKNRIKRNSWKLRKYINVEKINSGQYINYTFLEVDDTKAGLVFP